MNEGEPERNRVKDGVSVCTCTSACVHVRSRHQWYESHALCTYYTSVGCLTPCPGIIILPGFHWLLKSGSVCTCVVCVCVCVSTLPVVALVSGLPHPLSTVITLTRAICVVEAQTRRNQCMCVCVFVLTGWYAMKLHH